MCEGLHTCMYLDHPDLQRHKMIVRLHNIEWEYYKQTGQKESNWIKKLFYSHESALLKKYEYKLKYADKLLCISHNDTEYYKKYFPKTSHYLPVFHQHDKVNIQTGKGDFILYHGNLEINENIEAVNFIIDKIHTKTQNFNWIIAGKNPSKSLINKCKDRNIKIFSNLSHEEMNNLIKTAHINILPTFQDTGIKLKLLNALFMGRFCLVNPPMVDKTGLEECCIIAKDAAAFIDHIHTLMNKAFTSNDIEPRKNILETKFNNDLNAQKMIELIGF